MNDTTEPIAGQLAKLLALVAENRDRDRQRILDEAKREADELVAHAHQEARASMKKAVAQSRRRHEEAVRAANARVETDRRNARLQETACLLEQGRRQLAQALRDRWHTPETRHLWIQALLATARLSLPPGAWSIFHPPGWSPAELDPWRDPTGEEITFQPDATIEAGLRIAGQHAQLDGTMEGMLANRGEIDSLLLALLSKDAP